MCAVLEFRVTKYDPAFRRGHRGPYTREEWTSISDVGRTVGGVPLTQTEYLRVEDAYVSSADAFLREAKVIALTVAGLENPLNLPLPFSEGAILDTDSVPSVIRRVLREEFWCRLEGADSFVHVGYDYYMYIGVPVECPAAVTIARQLGLFPEPFPSPYREGWPNNASG